MRWPRLIHGENLGDLFRFGEARAQLLAGIDAARRTHKAGFELRLSARLGTLSGKEADWHMRAGETASALRAAQDAWQRADAVLPVAEAEGNMTLAISMSNLKARVMEFRGELAAARQALQSVLERAVKVGYVSPVAVWSLQLAAIERRIGEPAAALNTLERAWNITEALRPTFRMIELCETLAAVEAELGHARAAADWRERSIEESRLFAVEQSRARTLLNAQTWRHGMIQA